MPLKETSMAYFKFRSFKHSESVDVQTSEVTEKLTTLNARL
jgi:hypothetical protein